MYTLHGNSNEKLNCGRTKLYAGDKAEKKPLLLFVPFTTTINFYKINKKIEWVLATHNNHKETKQLIDINVSRSYYIKSKIQTDTQIHAHTSRHGYLICRHINTLTY